MKSVSPYYMYNGDPVDTAFTIDMFCHPLVNDLVAQLNNATGDPIAALCDPSFLTRLATQYQNFLSPGYGSFRKTDVLPLKLIELRLDKPYGLYNWELLYYLPIGLAVHQSQRGFYAEAEKTFHLVFDPTTPDTSVPAPERYWRFLGFRGDLGPKTIAAAYDILLSTNPADNVAKTKLLQGFLASQRQPFQPFVAARSHLVSFQYYVVMKYLDNLIAWGDSLFSRPTIETVNEATLCYARAANLLGARPQQIPPVGTVAPMSYRDLKNAGLDTVLGNAMVELEGQFCFDLPDPGTNSQAPQGSASASLFGVRPVPYFCVGPNTKLLGYWDTVDDRLAKIRNCQNLQGQPLMLPLFDPKIDPALLVKALAAGLDIDTVLTGINQPAGPVRAHVLIGKALELAGEVRAMGSEFLSAIEKGNAEHLAAMRQRHETLLHSRTREIRFLQWQQAQKATNALIANRQTALARYNYTTRLLGRGAATDTSNPDRPTATSAPSGDEITADNLGDFLNQYLAVDTWTATLPQDPFTTPDPPQTAAQTSGASGTGKLYLTGNEQESNDRIGDVRDLHLAAGVTELGASGTIMIPELSYDAHYWGLGVHGIAFSGRVVAEGYEIAAKILRMKADYSQSQGTRAGMVGAWERRADEWVKEARLAAADVTQIGRQIVASLIAEQAAAREYHSTATQADDATEALAYLNNDTYTTAASQALAATLQATKFSNEALYLWQESALTDLHQRTYQFAVDTARRAEQLMKRELMRPEVDQITYIQPNYWDAGRKGLLAGQGLYQDLKRMELDYLDHNQRELELTRTISLRQLAPRALLALKLTGACTFSIPEWFFDRDCPGHYLRRIKNVALSVPALAGADSSVNLTLTLQKSTLRINPTGSSYPRDAANDDNRFQDFIGTAESIVTSSGSNDSGLFETNLHDERYLPFEGAGAISTWTLSLPPLASWDYGSITDVKMVMRYTARDAGATFAAKATDSLKRNVLGQPATSTDGTAPLLLNLRHDFPDAWWAFTTGNGAPLAAELQLEHFPYPVFNATTLILDDPLTLYTQGPHGTVANTAVAGIDLQAAATAIKAQGRYTLSLPPDATVLTPTTAHDVYLLINYHLSW